MTQAKPQRSRKGKKAWRSNVDIKDIEKDLSAAKHNEIHGRLEDRPLFVLDTKGTIGTKVKTLYCDQILKSKSLVPALRRTVRSSVVPIQGKYKPGKVSKVLKLEIERLAKTNKKLGRGVGTTRVEKEQRMSVKAERKKKLLGGFDLWESEATITNKSRKKLAIPAVELAHCGASYNPSVEMHKLAMEIAAKPEFDKIDKDQKLKSQLAYPKELDLLEDNEVIEANDSKSDTASESDGEVTVLPVKRKAKTQADRNRKERASKQLLIEQKNKEKKVLMKQINS
jgi:nucleolar protein 53